MKNYDIGQKDKRNLVERGWKKKIRVNSLNSEREVEAMEPKSPNQRLQGTKPVTNN